MWWRLGQGLATSGGRSGELGDRGEVNEVGREAAKEIGGRLAARLRMIRKDVGREGGTEVGTEDGRPLQGRAQGLFGSARGFDDCLQQDC